MMTRLAFRRPGPRPQRGQILLIFAISSVALFGILALAFDGGRILMEQRSLQNAVDGAALTGSLEIGPGTSAIQSHIGKDDAVYAIEKSLGISFSNNYTSAQQHYLNAGTGTNCGAVACNPPYSDACCTWNDTTGNYTLTVATPYNWNASDNEAYIHVDLVHHLPLLIGGQFFPNLDVHVQSTARNYALPFALYTLKYYDPSDYNLNGTTILSANKKMGTNGGTSYVGGGSIKFTCTSLPSLGTGYGGDLYEYVPAGAGVIAPGSVTTGCSSGSSDLPIGLQNLPPLHLPPDPYGSAASPAPTNASVSGGTYALQPTIPADPSAAPGPRYGTVNVGSGGTLILLPGVYFFEGTSSAGLGITNNTGVIATGDCFGYTVPTCWTQASATNPVACPLGFTGSGGAPIPSATVGTLTFACKSPDFGALLVFYPAGSDVTASNSCTGVNPTGSTNTYCTKTPSSSGGSNQLSVMGGSSIYVSSSPRYHNVAVFVDESHANGTSLNFTASTSLSNAGCASSSCADQIGLGSHVVIVNGGGNISILGAIVAPDDNVQLGGASGGSGYGQVISYTLSTIGNGTIVESYNPAALAYSPVIVQ